MKIALYGGSFDPPHIAHLQIIKEALRQLDIDLLIVMVAFQNPFKTKSLFDDQTRLGWMQTICKTLHKVVVSDFEIKNQIVFTIDTIKHLQEFFNPSTIFLILGEDHFMTLQKWKDYEVLKQKVHFVLVRREGFEYNADCEKYIEMELKDMNFSLSSSMIKKNPITIQDFIPDLIAKEVQKALKEKIVKQQRIDVIIEKLSEKKAEDIVCLDVSHKDYIVDHVIIATAMAGRHTLALLDMLKTELKPKGEIFYAVDEESEDWIVIDLGDIMIHLFTQSHREKFNLEDFLKKDLLKNP